MSFEGYYQHICEQGHYSTSAVYPFGGDNKSNVCKIQYMQDGEWKICNSKMKQTSMVDDTNMDAVGYRKLIKLSPEIAATCSFKCQHVLVPATYKLSDEQYYFDRKTETYLPMKSNL